MHLSIRRLSDNHFGTFGVLMVDGQPYCWTLERRYRRNARNISCIPPGTYRCKRKRSRRFGATWEVLDVENRSGILFHAGNKESDSRGCILLGEKQLVHQIADSRKAMAHFRELTEDEKSLTLVISNEF